MLTESSRLSEGIYTTWRTKDESETDGPVGKAERTEGIVYSAYALSDGWQKTEASRWMDCGVAIMAFVFATLVFATLDAAESGSHVPGGGWRVAGGGLGR